MVAHEYSILQDTYYIPHHGKTAPKGLLYTIYNRQRNNVFGKKRTHNSSNEDATQYGMECEILQNEEEDHLAMSTLKDNLRYENYTWDEKLKNWGKTSKLRILEFKHGIEIAQIITEWPLLKIPNVIQLVS